MQVQNQGQSVGDELFTPSLPGRDWPKSSCPPLDTVSLVGLAFLMGILPLTILAHMNARWLGFEPARRRGTLMLGISTFLAAIAVTFAAGSLMGRDGRDLVWLLSDPLLACALAAIIVRDQRTALRTYRFYHERHFRNFMVISDAWVAIPLLILAVSQLEVTLRVVNFLLNP